MKFYFYNKKQGEFFSKGVTTDHTFFLCKSRLLSTICSYFIVKGL